MALGADSIKVNTKYVTKPVKDPKVENKIKENKKDLEDYIELKANLLLLQTSLSGLSTELTTCYEYANSGIVFTGKDIFQSINKIKENIKEKNLNNISDHITNISQEIENLKNENRELEKKLWISIDVQVVY